MLNFWHRSFCQVVLRIICPFQEQVSQVETLIWLYRYMEKGCFFKKILLLATFSRNIAKVKTSQAITPFHFIDYSSLFGFYRNITFIIRYLLFLSREDWLRHNRWIMWNRGIRCYTGESGQSVETGDHVVSSLARVTSVNSSVGILTDQNHISKVSICSVIDNITSSLERLLALWC